MKTFKTPPVSSFTCPSPTSSCRDCWPSTSLSMHLSIQRGRLTLFWRYMADAMTYSVGGPNSLPSGASTGAMPRLKVTDPVEHLTQMVPDTSYPSICTDRTVQF
ncbi:hypothetical protein RV134_50004 [Roseovarius sp. EC-HK134]|nr:hypothetical protein RV420_10018 [Roseovarius sp. EC-SD190]VVT34076.1 hypothetical protein RV134_50004 [Roseovarius sp. EC-HK134]